MKKIILPICILLAFSCQTKRSAEDDIKKSLWTPQEFEQFINENSITDFDTFYNEQLIYSIMYELTYKELTDTLKTQGFKEFYQKNKEDYYKKYDVDISLIAGKSKGEVEVIFGNANNSETVNPSGTPCPCDKLFYLNNLVEIVFINGIADWITVNNRPNYISAGSRTNYVSLDQFDDYTYVKVKTK